METQYIHFLKPLRVLADNWDIDLATELSEYVDEVERLSQQLQSGETIVGVNFAQAALLIQNSASIYSKKVQYLYNLTQETHEYIFHRKGHANAAMHDGDHGDLVVMGGEEEEDALDCLDDCLVQKDCRLSRAEISLQGPALPKLNWSGTTPGIRNESQEELMTVHGETIGYRNEFEMNDALITEEGSFQFNILLSFLGETVKVQVDGAIIIPPCIPDMDLAVTDAMQEASQAGAPLPENPFDMPIADYEPCMPADGAFDSEAALEMPQGMNDDRDEEKLMPPMEPNTMMEDAMENLLMPLQPLSDPDTDLASDRVLGQPPPTAQPSSEEMERKRQREILDFWTMLEPHDAPATTKGFRKGAVNKAYRVVEKSVKESEENKQLTTTVREFLQEMESLETHKKALPKNPIHRLFFPEFDYIYFEEKQRREDLLRTHRDRKAVDAVASSADVGLSAAANRIHVDDNLFDLPAQGQLPGQEIYAADPMLDIGMGMDDEEDDHGEFSAPMFGASSTQPMEQTDSHFQSFETLCKLRIQNYLEKATSFEQQIETVLAKNVRRWETRLQPLLEEQHGRNQYDIDIYRDKVLHAFHEKFPTSAKGKENAADPVPFESIATGVEKFDVCRYFLASLHLANEGRVQISKSDDNRMLVTPLL